MKLVPHCPICGSFEFLSFNGRPAVRCSKCHSMERSRLMFALLERTGRIRRGISVLHFAPEFGIAARLKPLAAKYLTADLRTEQYSKAFPDVESIDLVNGDLSKFASGFDLILHNHVLEHIPCELSDVLTRLIRCLKPQGCMYFSVPIRKGASSTEDTDFNMSANERRALFGQEDHVRMLGDQDVLEVLSQAEGGKIVALDEHEYLSDADLEMMNIPRTTGLSGATVFVATRSSVKTIADTGRRTTRAQPVAQH